MKTGKRAVYGSRQVIRRLSGVVLAVLLFCGTSLTALAAADAPSLDLEKTGSITVTLCSDSENQTAVTDGTLTLYRAADLYLDNGNMAYAYTEPFSDCEEIPDVTDVKLAAALAEYVSAHEISGTAAEVGKDGSVTFADLSVGLYLVVQTGQSEGYYTAEPFLVTLPLAVEDEWVYDVDAAPKMEELKEIPETPSETETPSGPTEPETQPGTEETDTGEDEEDEEEDEDEETVPVLPGSSSGTSGSSSSGSSGTLPQTGQLNWPIPVMAAGGLLLIAVGMFLQRKETAAA